MGSLELPGIAETALPAGLMADLPADAPPAPWNVRCRAAIWWTRPDRTASAALKDVIPAAIGAAATPLLTVGAMVSYEETPVGPYSEVLAAVVLRKGSSLSGHVPFMAVDSPASIVGGRTNWALPKTLAEFRGWPQNNAVMEAVGPGWAIQATPRSSGPPLPWLLPSLVELVQIGPDGTRFSTKPRGRGTARLARVTVEASTAPGMTSWYPAGRCFGILSENLTGYLPPASRQSSSYQPR